MTEDNSPENLRKFLESDDPALVMMGISLAKGAGVPEEMLGLVAGLYMWHDDKGVRAAAKSTFIKHAPDELKNILKGTWNTSYRTVETEKALKPKVETMFQRFRDTPLDAVDVWRPAVLGRTSRAWISIVQIMDGFGAEAAELLIKVLGEKDEYALKRADLIPAMFHISLREALVRIGKPSVEPLTKALRDDNEDVRWDYDVRWTVYAAALGDIGDKRAVEPLIKALKDDEYDRYSVAYALGAIGDKRAVEPLIKLLRDRVVSPVKNSFGIGKYNRTSVARALGNIGDTRAVEPLIEAIEAVGNDDWWIRVSAAEALGEIGDVRAVDPLITLLETADWWMGRDVFEDYEYDSLNVFVAASQALGKLGQSFPEEIRSRIGYLP